MVDLLNGDPRPRRWIMKAIISDIHANLEALRAVLDDIDSKASRRSTASAT